MRSVVNFHFDIWARMLSSLRSGGGFSRAVILPMAHDTPLMYSAAIRGCMPGFDLNREGSGDGAFLTLVRVIDFGVEGKLNLP